MDLELREQQNKGLGNGLAAPRAEQTRFRGLIDGHDAIVWEAEPGGCCRFVSCRAEELLGYPTARWLAEPDFWLELVHADDRRWAAARRQQCLREARDQEFEYRLVTANGRIVWVRESVEYRLVTAGDRLLWVRESVLAVRDERGRLEALRGELCNLGPRKKVDQLLETVRRDLADMMHLHELSRRLWATTELEPLLGEILAATTTIQGAEMGLVCLYDPARGDLETVASLGLPPAYLERYGRLPVGVNGCGLAYERGGPVIIEDVEIDPDSEPFRDAAHLGGYRAEYSALLVSRSGAPLGTIATFFPAPHRPPERQVRLVELFARQAADFVENARLHRELREADRRKDEALAVLAHELRNPLSAILTAAHTLVPAGAEASGLGASRDLIVRQVRRMARLVDDVFDASRIARGQVELRPEPVDLGAVMAGAVEAVRPLIEARGHELTVTPPPALTRLAADPARLEQILVNLLVNAARYTEPGGRIALEAGCDGDQAVIRVRDTGIGIPPELLHRIFEPFLQGDPGSHPSRGGLGLGLALVRGLVERHGGTVTVTSDGPGLGSEFTVTLPLGRPEVSTPPPAAASLPSAGTRRAARVLVVDDQPDAAESLARLLASQGHETFIAYDGPAALAQAEAHPPEVALLDIGLPGMDGHELARRLRALCGPGLRIAAVSGFGQDGDRWRARQAGFDHYLVKPVAPEDLLRWLRD